MLRMAYKNVNKRVNTLISLGLLEQADINDAENKHKAKYYRLSEYGIYQLFLKSPSSVVIKQSDVRRGNELASSASIFFNNYSSCQLFEIFLYPYFSKNTLFAIKDRLLLDLYLYLSNCCHKIERSLKYSKLHDIPLFEKIFSWNKVPGEDYKLLLFHLAQLFNLEDIESSGTAKKDTVDVDLPTITVSTNSAPIMIKLDKKKNEVVIMSNTGNAGFQKFVYGVQHKGDEMIVSHKIPQEDSLSPLFDETEKQMQQLIYNFVSDLESSPMDSESLYCYDVLSRDKKFMRVVQKIYENRHKGFERGYAMLTSNQ